MTVCERGHHLAEFSLLCNQPVIGASWVRSKAKLSGSVENLICEMDKMLCRHRKTGVASICGQVDQPFGQGEWASERA
jgi:hypothetical protein